MSLQEEEERAELALSPQGRHRGRTIWRQEASRWQSASQEESSHQRGRLLASWAQVSSLKNCQKINVCCLSHPVCAVLLWLPKQINILSFVCLTPVVYVSYNETADFSLRGSSHNTVSKIQPWQHLSELDFEAFILEMKMPPSLILGKQCRIKCWTTAKVQVLISVIPDLLMMGWLPCASHSSILRLNDFICISFC